MAVIFFEGPDGCGKTEISTRFSQDTGIKRFKVETEKENWLKSSFKQSLPFDALLPSFVEQVQCSFISDRGYASEWVYSQVFERETDMELLNRLDERWASMGAYHVVLLRRDYSNVRHDELVDKSFLQKLHEKYIEFVHWTSTSTMALYVDSFMNGEDYDLNAQIQEIYAGLEAFKVKQKYPRVYDLIRNGEV